MNKLSLSSYIICLVFLCGFQTQLKAQQNKPNVVLIISDDHGVDALGSYGNPIIQTPNLDNLAKDGTRFTSAFATVSSCSPSRSVILTGLQNHSNGMYGLAHEPHHFRSFSEVVSLSNRLNKSDYRTARIGKFHVAPEKVYHFQKELSPGTANDPSSIGRSPVEMADSSRKFITQKSTKPFFLLYATDDPHRSNVFTSKGQVTFDTYPDPNPFGNREEGYPGVKEITYNSENVKVPSFLPDNEATRAELAQYYQSVSRMDQGIGHLIEILKKAGRYKNTLIIYVSDHGAAFPGAKTTLYDPGIHIPFIVKEPQQKNRGIVQNGMVSLLDITPTILDYAQVTADSGDIQGRSFRELVEKEQKGDVQGWNEVYGSHTMHGINMYYPMRMVRTRRYKLIYNIAYKIPFKLALDLVQSPTWISVEDSSSFGHRDKDTFFNRPVFELYDLKNDPDEVHNLADSKDHQDVLKKMIEKIKDFQERTLDPRTRQRDIQRPIMQY